MDDIKQLKIDLDCVTRQRDETHAELQQALRELKAERNTVAIMRQRLIINGIDPETGRPLLFPKE